MLEVAVIGAGVIGLAVARVFASQGREVFVFEAERGIGNHTSSRNSEVVHSGIYYPATTPLKAHLCVAGRAKLDQYCREHGVPFRVTGKLLLATTDEEIPKLDSLREQGRRNGVRDLILLDRQAINALEPRVRAVLGLFSPSTGIVDSHRLMSSLKRDAAGYGATLMLGTRVLGGKVEDNGIRLTIADGDASSVVCQTVVNCAGLGASQLAYSIEGLPRSLVPETHYAKGHYFTIDRRPFSHLVYPMPVAGGLGIHVTLDIEGNVRFGPDVQWVDQVDYGFDAGRVDAFYPAIQRYYPDLKDGALRPGYTGIRPKVAREGEPDRDFLISGPAQHGIAGLMNLFGIESPGLTASLALADYIAGLV